MARMERIGQICRYAYDIVQYNQYGPYGCRQRGRATAIIMKRA